MIKETQYDQTIVERKTVIDFYKNKCTTITYQKVVRVESGCSLILTLSFFDLMKWINLKDPGIMSAVVSIPQTIKIKGEEIIKRK